MRVSKLEEVFGFENLAFRQYMAHQRLDSVVPKTLANYANQMAEYGHPIVSFAAGWAVAEMALYRIKRGRMHPNVLPSRSDRMQALDVAGLLWKRADTEFAELIRGSGKRGPKFTAELWGMQVRSRLAKAYIPAMRLVASNRSTESDEKPLNSEAIKDSHRQVIRIGKQVVSRNVEGREAATARSGLAYEIIGALLMQGNIDTDTPPYILMPASIRKDHNHNPYKRADLAAAGATAPYTNTFVQVSGHNVEKAGRNPYYCYVRAEDLQLRPGYGSVQSLHVYTDHACGYHTGETDLSTRLQTMSAALLERLTEVHTFSLRPSEKTA